MTKKKTTRRPRPAAKKREIFRFFDGREQKYADPLRLLGQLDNYPEWRDYVQAAVVSVTVDAAKLSPQLAAQVADKPKLIGNIAAIAQEVFDVKPLGTGPDGKPVGLTDVECVGLLSDFMLWCAATSEAYRPLANWPARPATSPAESDTAPSSASTSTAT